jgi:hypothetical protein
MPRSHGARSCTFVRLVPVVMPKRRRKASAALGHCRPAAGTGPTWRSRSRRAADRRQPGAIARPLRAIDILTALHRRGAINAEMCECARGLGPNGLDHQLLVRYASRPCLLRRQHLQFRRHVTSRARRSWPGSRPHRCNRTHSVRPEGGISASVLADGLATESWSRRPPGPFPPPPFPYYFRITDDSRPMCFLRY